MTKTIWICDKCKKEADRLYKFPSILKEGLAVNVYHSDSGKMELCESCLDNHLDQIHKYTKE